MASPPISSAVTFPPSDNREQQRFVRLSATVNGQPISRDFDVTRLVAAGEEKKAIRFDDGVRAGTAEPRVLDFAAEGVPRFEANEQFDLTAEAYTSDGLTSAPETKSVEVYLPVIILHGYLGPKEWDPLLAPPLFPVVYDPLREYLKDKTTGEFVTGYTSDDTWYKTLWGAPMDCYRFQQWGHAEVGDWLDALVNDACASTYAIRVNLVGHSLGGIIGRYYATRYGRADRVHKVITVGSPHRGSSLFYILSLDYETRKEVRKQLDAQPLLRWLIPTYQALIDAASCEPIPFDQDLFRPPYIKKGGVLIDQVYPEQFDDLESPPAGVKYYSIFSRGLKTPYQLVLRPADSDGKVAPWYAWPEECACTDEVDRCPAAHNKECYSCDLGDGVVLESSAELASAVNMPLWATTEHSLLPTDPGVQALVLEALRDE